MVENIDERGLYAIFYQSTMTKSPLALAKTALEAAHGALPAYSSVYSRRDFTQPQLFTLIVLRQFLKTDYRGLIQMLADWSDLRKLLAITKLPHCKRGHFIS